jgi:hypothetical protein
LLDKFRKTNGNLHSVSSELQSGLKNDHEDHEIPRAASQIYQLEPFCAYMVDFDSVLDDTRELMQR